ncbi:MAG: DUF4252 domain-containing protein [Tannerellaceae bacterium]
MKKISLILTFVMLCFMQAKAIDVEGMFAKYKKADNAFSVRLGYPIMKLSGLIISARYKEARIVRSINSLRMVDLSDCSKETQSQFRLDADSLLDTKYKELAQVKTEDDNIRVLAKCDDKVIKDMIILLSGEDVLLVRLKGNMDLKKYMEYVIKYTEKKK